MDHQASWSKSSHRPTVTNTGTHLSVYVKRASGVAVGHRVPREANRHQEHRLPPVLHLQSTPIRSLFTVRPVHAQNRRCDAAEAADGQGRA